MQLDEPYNSDNRSSGSDQGNVGTTSRRSAKLRAEIDKLAKWRVDPSSIMFPEDTYQIQGGHATVSRAILAANSGGASNLRDTETTEGGRDLGEDTLGHKTVAVKSPKVENESDQERVLGLALREAGFLVELSHENIIPLEGFAEDLQENRIWLIFPWEDNGNLKDFVASQNWEIPERIWLIDDVTRGVEYLHSRDPPIYHGDLKSINVLVSSKYRAVITDFGSARRLTKKPKHPGTPPTQNDNRLETPPTLQFQAKFDASTNTMTLTGNEYTLRWAAPELLMDDEPGLWSDIWSLGWICYEVMTGSIPFQHVRKDSVVVKQVIQGNLPSVTDHVRMSLILQLCSIIIKCWSIDPAQRPTAEDCQKAMRWLPMTTPGTQRNSNTALSGARNPELLMSLGEMYTSQDDYTTAQSCFTEALDMCTGAADNARRAYALLKLADLHRYQSRYHEALELYSEAVQIYTHIGDRGGRADAEFGLAEVYRAQDQYKEAVRLYSEALQIYTDIGNSSGRADALFGLASAHTDQDKYSQAISLHSEAAQIYAELGDDGGRVDALYGLAEVHRHQKEYSEAITIYTEVLQVYNDIGDRNGRAWGLWGLANVYRVQKEYSKAATLLSEAIQIFTDIGDRQGRAFSLSSLADVHRDQDHHSEALGLYDQAVEVFEQIGNNDDAAKTLAKAASLRR